MSHISFEKDFAHHPLHYFTLLCVFLTGLWGIYWFDYYRPLQIGIVVSVGVAYVVWGVVHHTLHKDLHLKIIFEYIMQATLAILVFTSLVLRS